MSKFHFNKQPEQDSPESVGGGLWCFGNCHAC